jgi:hypothetical protein
VKEIAVKPEQNDSTTPKVFGDDFIDNAELLARVHALMPKAAVDYPESIDIRCSICDQFIVTIKVTHTERQCQVKGLRAFCEVCR